MQSSAPKSQQFPCPSCGGRQEFNPKTGQLECGFCGQAQRIAKSNTPVVERSYDAYLAANHTQLAALSAAALEVKCPGCNAQFAFEPPTVAGQCPFCSTSIVEQPHSASPVETPEAVLPFQVDQQAAQKQIQQWLRQRRFAPSGLHKLSQQAAIQGIYLPFWIYDCHTSSDYRGERGTHYTETETYSETNSEGESETKMRDVQKTRWTSVSGHLNRGFDDVLVAGTKAVNSDQLDAVSDWDLSKLVAYDASYLAGFKAQRYQVNLKVGFEQAKTEMAEQLCSDIEREIGGDEQKVNSVSTSYSDTTFKHTLLPVWLSSYQFKGCLYSVMVNAQTGKVAGNRPFSRVKIASAVLAVVTATAGMFGASSIRIYLDNRPVIPSPNSGLNRPPDKPQPAAAQSSSPVPSDETFRQAVQLAQTAGTRGQTAKTPQDWQQTVNLWEQAAVLMQQVPPASPNHAMAQQKATEYQRNLSYAKQQVARAKR